jgi:hypothetical protein
MDGEDRENAKEIGKLQEKSDRNELDVRDLWSKIGELQKELEKSKNKCSDECRKVFVSIERYSLVEKIVYAAIGVVCLSFLTGLIYWIMPFVKKGGP